MQGKIKQHQIITELFGFITYLMIERDIVDPLDVHISLAQFEEHLNAKLGTQIKSIQHIYQQIRAYERTHFVKLCNRLPSSTAKDDIVLSVADARTYQAKSFLHVGLKLALAHGLYDLISHVYQKEQRTRALNIYCSAGTESLYLAQRLLDTYEYELNIYTHNLGIIQTYIQHYIHRDHIHLYTRFGKIHKETYTILEGTDDLYAQTTFDVIIGTTTYIDQSGLYIESEEEHRYKHEAYKVLRGLRILMLTLFEFTGNTHGAQNKYANIDDFDYIIVPSQRLVHSFREYLRPLPFESFITYYTYEVLKKAS